MKSKQEAQLKKLHRRIKRCRKCNLSKTRTKAVPGEGSANAKILFLGEAPGRNEDLTGRPFIGRAGQLLTLLIESIGLKRKDVFITSILRCRPPANRKPKPDEIDACRAHLDSYMDFINPRIVVLLGSTAMYTILGKKVGKITEIHGKTIKRDGITYFPTYHPAAGLRSAKVKRAELETDFRKLKNLLVRNQV